MKKGGSQTAEAGFTIVETLIVLAVSSMLLVSAILLINGRQSKTAFMTSINDLQQQLQQIINETSSGYFPSSNNFTCQAGNAANGPVFTAASGNGQGTNGGCVFIGKAIQFGSGATAADTGGGTGNFVVYPLAGNRTVSGVPATNLLDAHPIALSPTQGTGSPNGTDNIPPNETRYTADNGVVFRFANFLPATYPGQSNTSVIAFLSSLGSVTGAGYQTGTQQLGLYAVYNTVTTTNTGYNMVKRIDGMVPGSLLGFPAATFQPLTGASICFDSGTTNQSGLISIGSAQGGLSVSLQIFTNKGCV